MARFNSYFVSYVHLSTIFFILLVLMKSQSTFANPMDVSSDSALDLDFSSIPADSGNYWPARFQDNHLEKRYAAFYQPTLSMFRQHDFRFPLQPKRSIPIELQKALFAHGIVGRRR